MPARPHPLRLLVAFAALLLAVAIPAAAQDAPPADPQIAVVFSDGDRTTAQTWSSLQSVPHSSGPVQLPDGRTQNVSAITLGDLLRAMGVAGTQYSSLTAPQADGTPLKITKTQVVAATDELPIVYLDAAGGTLKLLSPATSITGRAALATAADDGVLTLTLQQDATVTASQSQALVGQKVTFTATLPTTIPDGSAIGYQWDFNDDSAPVDGGAEITRAFKRTGTYNVGVTFLVNGRPQEGEIPVFADPVEVVEDPSRVPPRRAPTVPRRPTRRGPDETTVDEGDDGQQQSGGGTPYVPPSTPTYTPPASTPAPTAPVTPSTPAPQPQPRRTPKPARRRAQTVAQPQGEVVDGYLLASASTEPIPAGGLQQRQQAKPAARQARTLEIPAAAWVLAGLAALVMLGWGLEARTTLPYFKP